MPVCFVCGLPINVDYCVVSKDSKESYHLNCFNDNKVFRPPTPIVKEIVTKPGELTDSGFCTTCGRVHYQKATEWAQGWIKVAKLQEQATGGLTDD